MIEGDATVAVRGPTICIRQFSVTVVDGPDRDARAVSASDRLAIGTTEGNDLRLTDAAVSRHHCELRADPRGLAVIDLGSRNGTRVDGVDVRDGLVRDGSKLVLGTTTIVVRILDTDVQQPLASTDRLGGIVGASPAMRRLYPLIEQCAHATATVLITGETGTGKELIAEAIHEASGRGGPFVVVDCGALAHDLAESELFGHERGAVAGAAPEAKTIGAFEAAEGGTVFLDEIGELPLALQPLLLRVLEARTLQRIGSTERRAIDVRVVAASHRDLRSEVNLKHFRADLFYRLNALRIEVPPLRERAGDVELLAAHFWSIFRPDVGAPAALLQHLAQHSWPGNVRELRNAVERAALFGWQPAPRSVEPRREQLTYQQAKERAVWAWERGWVEQLLTDCGGNLSRAARMAKMGRSHLRELARRHGVQLRPSAVDLANDD